VSDQFTRGVSFDPFEYFGYLRTRWKFLLASCLAAAILAIGISMTLPKRYTATASILIDAPAGNDPRAATAVSPVYLESLRTYEHFADSDTLFMRAMERFNLRDEAGAAPVESLKRRVLKVTKPRDTKLLRISVALRDPAKAQGVVQFIAEETVGLNHSLARQSDEEFITQAHRQAELARAQLDETDKRLKQESAAEAFQSELGDLVDLKARLQREVTEANADLADYGAQLKTQPPSQDGDRLRRDVAGITARAEALRKEIDSVTRSIKEKQASLALRQASLERLEGDRRSARAVYDTAMERWNEAQSAAGNRGERLKIIDPGIVPQRPSSPNLPLNVFAAVFIACIAALLYVSIRFVSESRDNADARRVAYR
jgi:uncharacterized protein involved in exopolysaccharide biosynthesis